MLKKINPFHITKAVDLSTSEIESLWIDATDGDTDGIFRPTSPVPLLILGGKGSGKTHWMRYFSFPLQLFRFKEEGVATLEGLRRDGYIGVYVLLGGLNFERFKGRGQSDEVWRGLYEYYFELWLAQEIIQTLIRIKASDAALAKYEISICERIQSLFTEPPAATCRTFESLFDWCSSIQRALDSDINNVLYSGQFNTRFRESLGSL
jgi:hypothetical protein